MDLGFPYSDLCTCWKLLKLGLITNSTSIWSAYALLHLGRQLLVQSLELVHLGRLRWPANSEALLGAWLGNLVGGMSVSSPGPSTANTKLYHVNVDVSNLLVGALAIVLQDVVLGGTRGDGEFLGYGLLGD